MSENNAIHQSVSINAPISRVFKALTDARTLKAWFPSDAQTDLRPGGKYQFVFTNQDPQHNMTQEGEFVEVSPNGLVSYTWEAGGKMTRVNFSLREANGKTQVQLDHTGFGEDEAGKQVSEMHSGVWNIYMNNLKSFIEEEKDRRVEMLHQIVA